MVLSGTVGDVLFLLLRTYIVLFYMQERKALVAGMHAYT